MEKFWKKGIFRIIFWHFSDGICDQTWCLECKRKGKTLISQQFHDSLTIHLPPLVWNLFQPHKKSCAAILEAICTFCSCNIYWAPLSNQRRPTEQRQVKLNSHSLASFCDSWRPLYHQGFLAGHWTHHIGHGRLWWSLDCLYLTTSKQKQV